MYKLLFCCFLCITVQANSQILQAKLQARLDYFKSQPIYVVQLISGEIKGLDSQEQARSAAAILQLNKNIKTAFMTCWDISDTVIFVPSTELKNRKKVVKQALFFEPAQIGEYLESNGKRVQIVAFQLSCPKGKGYLSDVQMRLGIDSSLISVITEVRQLKLQMLTGKALDKPEFLDKTILIDTTEQLSRFHADYVKSIQEHYKTHVLKVDYEFILKAILRNDDRYIYIRRGSPFRASDGMMIVL